MSAIQASEIVEVFRQALRGEIAVKLLGDETWKEVFCGDVEFMFGDWKIVVFNDVLEFDYVDSVTAPDGRTAEFHEWQLDADPVSLLTRDELSAMESLVDGLTVGVRG